MTGYVPLGYITVYDAIGKLAARWYPQSPAATLPPSADPFLADLARSFAARKASVEAPRRQRQERLDTYARVRRVLAEGLLPSTIVSRQDGKRWQVPPAFWATSHANTDAQVSGVVSFHIDGVLVTGTPLAEERDIDALAIGDAPPSLLEAIARAASVRTQVDQKAVVSPSTPEPADTRNVGGRPPKIDWDGFWIKVASIANSLDGLPGRQELKRTLAQWIVDTGQEIGNTALTEKLAKLYDNPKRKPVTGG